MHQINLLNLSKIFPIQFKTEIGYIMKKIIFFLIGLLYTSLSFSYSVDNHEMITEVAIGHFNRCLDEGHLGSLSQISEKERRTLVDGNLHEDLLGPIRRLKQWHFWDPKRRNDNGKYINKTLHKRFDAVEKSIFKPLDFFSSKYSELGHLLHYLQDVTVPSHVVPIFHPAPPLFKSDGFDKYAIDTYNLENETSFNCSSLISALPSNFNELLDSYAKYTLKSIKEVIPAKGNKKYTWRLFWKEAKKNKRFGKYGKVGNRFGKEMEVKKIDTPFFMTREIYNNFAKNLHEKALQATIQAIMLYQLNHSENGIKYDKSKFHHDHNH